MPAAAPGGFARCALRCATVAAVSVLLVPRDPGPGLPDLLRSIDAQTLRTDRFELIVAGGSADGTADRLRQLAGRRPNVTVLDDAGGSPADRMERAFDRAAGGFVVALDQGVRLAPRALEVLLDRAERTGAGVVLGRVVTSESSGCGVLPDDADEIGVAPPDAAGCLALVRRDSLPADRAGAVLLDLPAVLREAGSVAAVGRYACAVRDAAAAATAGFSLGATDYRWEAGGLRVTARVHSSAAPRRAWLVAASDVAEVAVPAELTPVGDVWAVTAGLDPRVAEAGHPLGDGLWALRIRVAGASGEGTLPVSPGPALPAVVDGRPYAVRSVDGRLRVDAGATRSSVAGRVPVDRASVRESAAGSLLVLEQPDLHAHGDAVLPATVLLDRFELPAQLVSGSGTPRVEAYVGALAGSSAIRVLAGGGRPVPTGLRLRVSGTGVMRVDRDARPSPAPIPSRRRAPLVQRLRRRLPDALEPVARRLVEVPALRDAYRRLISR